MVRGTNSSPEWLSYRDVLDLFLCYVFFCCSMINWKRTGSVVIDIAVNNAIIVTYNVTFAECISFCSIQNIRSEFFWIYGLNRSICRCSVDILPLPLPRLNNIVLCGTSIVCLLAQCSLRSIDAHRQYVAAEHLIMPTMLLLLLLP